VRPTVALDTLVCGYSLSVRERKIIVIMRAPDKSDVYAARIDDSAGGEEGRILLLSAAILSYPEWSACFWQVGLAHFGGLIWPTLGR